MAAEMDTDNAEAFKNLRNHAEKSLESKIFGQGRTSAMKKLAFDKTPMEPDDFEDKKKRASDSDAKKFDKAHQKEESSKKKEAHRLWDLTPKDLKTLLPGRGAVQGHFWMRFHPVKKFWRADFPIGALSVKQVFFLRFGEPMAFLVRSSKVMYK